MSSQGESSDSCPDSEEVAGAVAEISQSDPSEHSDEENCSHKSSIWYFEGTLTMDLPPDDWNDGEMPDQGDMLLHSLCPKISVTSQAILTIKPSTQQIEATMNCIPIPKKRIQQHMLDCCNRPAKC